MGKKKVGKKGVVREAATHREVLGAACGFARENGFACAGLDFSPIKGPEGNIEFLLYVETTVDLLLPDHAWDVDPAVIYNCGYDHCRTLRGKSGTCQCRRTGSRLINNCCYIL